MIGVDRASKPGWMSTLRAAQIRSKIKENGFRAHNFPRLRRAERGFAFGTVLVSPKSATLTVTIIPVTLAVGVETRGLPKMDRGGWPEE